jgi:hypothetical protein
MAWLAVDEDGSEYIYVIKPFRNPEGVWDFVLSHGWETLFELPKGSIRKLIGRELTWDDEPLELKDDE